MYLQEPPRGDGASSSVNFLLSHLLTPFLLTPLHNTHTTSIPQHFYLTHSHSSLTLKFHTSLTYLKRAKHHSFPKVSYGSFSLFLSEGVTRETVGDYYCHLFRHPFVSQIKIYPET